MQGPPSCRVTRKRWNAAPASKLSETEGCFSVTWAYEVKEIFIIIIIIIIIIIRSWLDTV